MTYEVELPDGRVVEFPDEISREDAARFIRRQLGVGPQPKTGFVANVKAGIESLKGIPSALQAGVTGDKEAAAKALEYQRRAEDIATVPEFSEQPLEYLKGVAGRSAAYMGVPLVAGLSMTPMGRVAATGAGLLASGTQFTGTNLLRQLETGTTPEKLSVTGAVGAAVPQAALDYIGFRYIPGIRRIFGAAGVEIGNKEAAGIVSKFILPAVKTAGVEGATEAGQAVLERLQAGLELGSPEARKEYFENFLGGAVLGGALSIPGTVLEGRGPAEKQVVTPPAAAPTAPTAEAAPPDLTSPAAPGALALPAPEPMLALPHDLAVSSTPPVAVEAAPDVPVMQLMDMHDEYQTKMQDLALKIHEAHTAGDETTVAALETEYGKLKADSDIFAKKIEELGGFAGAFEPYAASAKTEITKLNKKIADLENKITQYRDPEVQDYEAARAIVPKLEAARAERDKKIDDFEYKQGLANVKGTPKDENISLFPSEAARPEPRNMLTLDARTEKGETVADIEKKYEQSTQGPQPEAEDYSKDIAEKEAEAEALLKELVANRAPKTVAPETVKAAVEALNKARADLRALQEEAARKPDTDMDDALRSAQGNVSRLSAQLTALSPKALREQHITTYNQKSTQLNKLYDEIDALRSGVVRTVPPPTLFSKRNQLVTAASTGDMDAVRRLLDYDAAQEKKETKAEPTLAEKGVKDLESKVKGRKVSQRIVFDDHYDNVMEEIETLRNKITTPQGNAKKSILQRAEELYPEIEALEKYIADPKTTAVERGNKRRTLAAKIKDYEPLQNAMTNARDKIDELLRSLHTVETVGTTAEIAAAEKQALDIAGKSKREKSREQKSLEKDQKGTVKASPERVAQELGEPTDAYAIRTKPLDTQIARLKAKLEKDKAYLKNVADTAKKKYGETSAEAKAAEAKMVKVTAAKQEAYYKSVGELNDKKDAIAREIGRANPWFRSTLVKATKDVSESAATAGEPVKRSRRTTQETRKVAKLGTMSTGTPESQARAASRQAGFEANLTEEKGQAADYARKQTEKKAESATAATAVGQALQKAAKSKIDKEKPKQQRGSEIESKDLTEAQLAAIENNDIRKALADIFEDTDNSPVNRTVAAALEAHLDNTNITVHDRLYDDEGYELLGQATSKQIDLSRKGLTQETLLHEGTHAAVERVIRMAQDDITQLGSTQQNAYRELQRLYAAIKNDPNITSKNAKRSISEFAAEALSNERLQEQLRAKKWTLGDAFKSFTSYILEMLGVKNVDNMLDASLASVEALMIPSSVQSKTAESAAAQRAAIGVVETAKGIFGFKSHVEPNTPSSIVAGERSVVDDLKANFLGLTGRVQMVDRFAAISEAFKKGLTAGQITSLEAGNAEYFMRFGENRSQYAQQVLTNGPIRRTVSKDTKDGKEYVYKSAAGANLMRVYEELNKAGIKNSTELDNMFTVYMAGKRAKQVGWDKLWVGDPAKAEAEHAAVMDRLAKDKKASDAFDAAAKEYRTFNNGLIDFLVDTGAMSEENAAKLKTIDYVPYYRADKGTGEVELFVDKELPVRIGNIKDEPQLYSLVGGNTQILPLSVSAVQNAFMLTDMGLRNQRVKSTCFTLQKLGMVSRIGEGTGPAGRETVRFKKNGKDHFAVIDTNYSDIPAELVVRGMEGIQTSLPAIVQLMGKPADIIRKFVTRNPSYAVRQAIRDPLTAWMTTGIDGVPILNSFKELSSMVAGRSDVEKKLMESGAISSNVFTGDERDMQKFLRDIAAGKSGWEKLVAKADAFAMQGDAATRAVVYKDSIAKGMTEQQALLRTLEAMNFGRRGLSPTVHWLNTMIPFFNAQIQGLDVLYRAFKGNMPYSEQLQIKKKLLARGTMLAMGTMAYALMMEDDEAYKRAKPEERLGNWFVYVPGVDEPLRVPIPFELGYIFKALPESLINMAAEDEKSKDITKGMSKLLMLSNPFSLPQAVKPLTEVYLGKSFFGGDIESQREIKTLLPTERYRPNTTELSKLVGSVTGDAGLTPIKMDYLIRGYTGSLGIAMASVLNPLLGSGEESAEQPSKKTSDMPFIGSLFQPVTGRGTQDAAYDRMLEIQQATGTYKRLLQSGDKDAAKSFLEAHREEIKSASMAGTVQQRMGEFAKMRRNIVENTRLSQEKKDELLAKIDAARNSYADRFLAATE